MRLLFTSNGLIWVNYPNIMQNGRGPSVKIKIRLKETKNNSMHKLKPCGDSLF